MQVSPDTAHANHKGNAGKMAAAQEMITLDVAGMKCAGCVTVVERQLIQHPGVISACVNLATEVASVACETGIVDPDALANQLTLAGFPTQPRKGQSESATNLERTGPISPAERRRQSFQQQLWRVAFAGILILLSGIGHLGQMGWADLPFLSTIWFHWGLATVALLGPGRSIFIDGWRGLRRNAPNMNTLVGLGAMSAYLASCVALLFPQLGWECFFDEPVMLLGFILLGRTLEQLARRRAANALEALISLQPATARLVADPAKNGSTTEGVEIPVAQVRVGEWLQVLPGEKIPVDGEVVAGTTTVDESMLTGEAVPVIKQPASLVAAGTLNQSGAIVVRATRTGKDTTLAQIVTLVEDAQTRKAPVQKLADMVAGYFTYGVMTIALLTFIFWYFAGTHLWPLETLPQAQHIASVHHEMPVISPDSALSTQDSGLLLSLKLTIAVLVIACPCALGLATPTAILVGTGIGAERGLLIRGGDVLEKVHQLDTVVFDKTGTLTTGHPALTDCLPIGNYSKFLMLNPEFIKNSNLKPENFLLQLAATVESGASHPLAVAIVEEAHRLELPLLSAQDFHTEPGLGVRALVNGLMVVLGTDEWLIQQGIAITEAERTRVLELASAGKTVVYVAAAGVLVGLIACRDTLRSDAKATLERLRQMGLSVMLLTGDRQEAADAIAQQLGLTATDVIAGVRPDGKATAIARLQAQGHRVAMVGDGINDAPALAQADVGIALHSGTDVAVETAGIVLMHNHLMDTVKSIELSRRTLLTIRQNLFWAFAYNTLGIPVAAGALLPGFGIVLSPAAAGALMAFSSISVVGNSLLLRRTFSRLDG
ncbi:copper-translocating P-type ATPase [Microcoleus sp. FACHB-68]|nr:copper-translocating P-type ATPase [Microcoleus sp. FACHB-68]